MFLLDSNVYIESFNDPGFGAAFRRFHQANLPRLILSAVVAHELLVGAIHSRRERALRKSILDPFQARRRIHVPSRQTWESAAEIDRGLRALGRYAGSLSRRSFGNDLLIAATARELGATLITRNTADFEIIAQVMPIRIGLPWPTDG